jgi:hypothetical protein
VNAGCRGTWRVSLSLPSRAVFDLLEQGGATLRRQAEALEAAGRGDEETAGLMKSQAELVERTIGTLRQPSARTKVGNGTRRGAARARQPRIPPLTTGIADGVPHAGGYDLDSSTCNGSTTPRSSAPSAPACEHELAPPAVETSGRLVAAPFAHGPASRARSSSRSIAASSFLTAGSPAAETTVAWWSCLPTSSPTQLAIRPTRSRPSGLLAARGDGCRPGPEGRPAAATLRTSPQEDRSPY